MSGSATQMLVAANAEFLRSYPPFDRMEPEALAFLAERLRLAYYAGESTIVDPEGGPVETLRIVQRGKVQVRQAGEVGVIEASLLTLGPGECFPIGSVTGMSAPIAAAIGSSIRYTWLAPALFAASRMARRSTLVEPDGTQITISG